jgi:RNA polymerase sigma-70 factor, ECF subfamily
MITNIPLDFAAQRERESDDQLLSEAKSGDKQAFAELCLRHRGMLMNKIYRIVRHREDAEDVLQETLLSAYQHLDSFRGACRFSSWMTRIGINRSLMLLRRRKSFSEIAPDVITDEGQSVQTREFRDPGPNPEQSYVMCRTLQALSQALDRLPPHFRGMMDLYYRRDLLLKDAAGTLGITEEAAKSRLMRARTLLRRSLNERWNASKARCKRPPNGQSSRDKLLGDNAL